MRFPKEDRIRQSFDFENVKESGKRFQSKHLVLLRLNQTEPRCRLGVIVTKKTGGAVIRNRWKRVLRDTFRLNRIQEGWKGDHVVIVRSSQKGAPPKSIREEWIDLCTKAQKR